MDFYFKSCEKNIDQSNFIQNNYLIKQQNDEDSYDLMKNSTSEQDNLSILNTQLINLSEFQMDDQNQQININQKIQGQTKNFSILKLDSNDLFVGQQVSFNQKQNNFENEESDDSQYNIIPHNQLMSSKKKKEQDQYNINYKQIVFRKNKQINSFDQLLSRQKNFYLYLDQVIDLEFFKNINNKDEYFRNNQHNQLYNGLRFINKIEHRLDNKFIELNMQNQEQKVYQIDYFIQFLMSIGNASVLNYVSQLQAFKSSIEKTQKEIQEQIQDPLFQQHQESRKKASQKVFKRLTSKMDGKKLIQYMKLSINYDKLLIESDVCGYSPSLYSIISQDSYTFKNQILQNGFFDVFQLNKRIENCMEGAIRYMNSPPTSSIQTAQNHYQEIDIITCDGFNFKTELKIQRYILDDEYDKLNNLQFKFKDILNVYEFTFKDELVFNQFQQFRKQQTEGKHNPDLIDQIFYYNDYSYKNTQFFKEYYQNQVEDLAKKGSKWFKRCGFIDIPKKKYKIDEDSNTKLSLSYKSTDSLTQ
ncbi:hypothetical protein TTHERM_00787020 (macronuclear) [Tetrahymena thermophila SB210]|uniref:Uncharacterized protein n=1 Tax=Tetrahymena thermophila (strain SB210) TaxID=312017 RepID=Q23ZG1_TETTS|nr:hypothetical protein TTHERM_00787020 [Tetrahymena thermophila SB210]EAS01896.2 hypothetical protein TTHERM_00787020 [Tetrahymena thermophila SB210]|eukprot:XP_001022141.2 hypothetical protein TTHERM_00787020 [Tetrahymena thermophila SB210]